MHVSNMAVGMENGGQQKREWNEQVRGKGGKRKGRMRSIVSPPACAVHAEMRNAGDARPSRITVGSVVCSGGVMKCASYFVRKRLLDVLVGGWRGARKKKRKAHTTVIKPVVVAQANTPMDAQGHPIGPCVDRLKR